MPKIPTSLYGEIDTDRLKEQQELLNQICQVPKTRDFEKIGRGEEFKPSGGFYTTGGDVQMNLTKPEGKHKWINMEGQRQGYKIHVSAHPEHAGEIAQAVVPLFRQTPKNDNPLGGVEYKISSLQGYVESDDEQQRGKFITIYARDEEQLKQIALAVQNRFRQLNITPEIHGSTLAPGDSKLGPQQEQSMMSMRWGQFDGNKKNQVYLGGQFTQDDRDSPYPESMKESYQKVHTEVNQYMEDHKQHFYLNLDNLGVEPNTNAPSLNEKTLKPDTRSQFLGTSTSRTNSNNNNSNLDGKMEEGIDSNEKKETKNVSESLKENKQKERRRHMRLDCKTVEEALKGNFPDKDPDDGDKGKKQTISTTKTNL